MAPKVPFAQTLESQEQRISGENSFANQRDASSGGVQATSNLRILVGDARWACLLFRRLTSILSLHCLCVGTDCRHFSLAGIAVHLIYGSCEYATCGCPNSLGYLKPKPMPNKSNPARRWSDAGVGIGMLSGNPSLSAN